MYLPEAAIDVIKIFTLGAVSFIIAFLLTPLLTHFLYKYKLWRKEVRQKAIDGGEVSVFQKFHKEGETNVPRMGGILIWGTVLITIFLFWAISKITDTWWLDKLNFLNRSQTWLPLFALVATSLLGLTDDILQIFGSPSDDKEEKMPKVLKLIKSFFLWCGGKRKYIGGGLSLKKRLLIVALIGLVGGWWFYSPDKLGIDTIHIPGNGDFSIGAWYIPLFILIIMAVYSGGVIDGLDGLAAGSFGLIFAAFAGIALFLGQIDIAAFCTVILGALLAFLWFNVPPARFYMGESGMMGLCAALTVITFLTDSVLVLPIIGFLLVIESGSVILQLLSKKFRHKKIFLSAPIHQHFEAKGWPHYKVTMRFWIIGAVMAIIGITIRLLG